jgi:PTS system nitrogen regulatory IIA component
MSILGNGNPGNERPSADGARLVGADLLTTKELAEYLRVNERTVLKLAAQGELPGARLGNQWRFRRAVIDAWLDDQMLGVRHGQPAPTGESVPTFHLEDGFYDEHVIIELTGNHVSAVLAELCARAHALGLVRDRTWFLGALLERENVLSSAVGGGVAFPHTLHRHPEQVRKPFVLVGRSTAGVEFSAPDEKPVHIVILMGLRYQELHLPWLSRLSELLRAPEVRSRLMAATDAREFACILQRCVHSRDGEPGPSSGDP